MYRNLRQSRSVSTSLIVCLVLLAAVCLLLLGLATRGSQAATPSTGTLTTSSGAVTYTSGPFVVSNPTDQVDGEPTCDATHPCDDFILTVNVPAGYDVANYVKINVSWPNQTTLAQYDIFVYKVVNPANNPPGPLVAANFFAVDPDVVTISAISGTYLLRIAPTIAQGDVTTTTVTLEQKGSAAPVGTGIAPRYQNYVSPPTLANSSGEPSIGVGKPVPGFPMGRTMFQANTSTLRVEFNDCSSPAAATWLNKTAPNTSTSTLDPILFTDRMTGRTIASQLAGVCSRAAYTDDDGDNYFPSQGCGVPAGVDHQTVGGGPYSSITAPPPPHLTYPNTVYYCSQSGTNEASCARSDNGGFSFGPAVPIYTISCVGIHGHIKVAPDGTAYVPNSDCSSGVNGTARSGLVFSDDNGMTWSAPQLVPDSNPASGIVDPHIGIGASGTLYFGYADSKGSPSIAVGRKNNAMHRIDWSPSQDVGAVLGIQNSTFPEVIAGDDNRAAYAFLGTTTGGYYQDPNNFEGKWYLFIATTFDGGTSWITVNATPNNPVQLGSICNSGTVICGRTPNDRNLLDFMDIAVDNEGRVEVAYPDGCITAACIQGVDRTGPGGVPDGKVNRYDNDQARKGTIARQSGGRRLFAAFDPIEPAVPKAPLVTAARNSSGVHLSWPEPDNSGSPLISYKVYRGTVSGQETLLATIPAGNNPTQYDDLAVNPGITYFYRVTAVNGIGEGAFCGEFRLNASGLIISEFRLRGQSGATDEFVELYNKTNVGITVGGGNGSSGFALVAPSTDGTTPIVLATIPNNTMIPSHGHYLIANTGYSLNSYAAPDITYTGDIPDNTGVALFSSSLPSDLTVANRLDAAGFSSANALYRENTGITAIGTTNGEYSFVRVSTGTGTVSGLWIDTDNNAADFVFISTTGGAFGRVNPTPGADGPSMLGVPGPENLASPIPRDNDQIASSYVDPLQCRGCAPNRERNSAQVPNGTLGTLAIRRSFTNNTGAAITRLRFRVIDITTLNSPGYLPPPGNGQADLRAITSTDVTIRPTGCTSTSCDLLVRGTTLEQPPTQALGGGLNSSLSAGTVTMAQPLAVGATINVQFVLGVQQSGRFRFFVTVDSAPAGSGIAPPINEEPAVAPLIKKKR